jgi:hypothetical protein
MGLYPCDFHGLRFRGPASHFYVSVATRGESDRRHLRLCANDALEYLECLSARLLLVPDDPSVAIPEATECANCGGGLSASTQGIFVTGYPRGDERVDFYGALHPECGIPMWLGRHTTAA